MHGNRASGPPHALAVLDRLPTRPRLVQRGIKLLTVLFVLVYIVPVVVSAALYYFDGNYVDWRSADRSSTGLLPSAADNPQPAVRIFSARTVSWRGIVASHSWIVIKEQNAKAYQRFDYTAWGPPIWVDRFAPDARWFGSRPEIVFAADGARAAEMIPTIKLTIKNYRYSKTGDYKLWPGPNSNTFVAAVMQAVPGMDASLPPTAIGKDFPYNERWIGLTPSRTGVRLNLKGYFGVTLGWVEGIEFTLPGLGRIALWH